MRAVEVGLGELKQYWTAEVLSHVKQEMKLHEKVKILQLIELLLDL